MGYKNIIIEKKEHICVLIINHPPANTWNLSTLEEFEHALNDLENDKNIRVIIITGSGDKCFSAGFDVTLETSRSFRKTYHSGHQWICFRRRMRTCAGMSFQGNGGFS
jgi:enoyl-CoA hydratase/carnithine racemase